MDGRPNGRNLAAVSIFSGLKRVFESVCFDDGLVWTVGLIVVIKLRLQSFQFLRISVDGAKTRRLKKKSYFLERPT